MRYFLFICGDIEEGKSMVCLNCNFYDKNDTKNACGTCEPQDTDFHCTHECNLSDKEVAELERLAGHSR